MEKQDALHHSYFNDNAGYGSATEQLTEARRMNPAVSMEDVNTWRGQRVEQTKGPPGYNSFVAEQAKQEYQADLAFF